MYNNSWFSDFVFTRAIPIFPCLSDHLYSRWFLFPPGTICFVFLTIFYSGKQRKANEEKRKEAERIQQMEDEIRRPRNLPHGTHEMGHGLMG